MTRILRVIARMNVGGPAIHATLLLNGKVLITKSNIGSRQDVFVRHAELFDPSTGTFAATGDMVTYHSFPTASLLLDGTVLIAGGDIGDGDGPSFVAELYDPDQGAFSATGSMTSPPTWSAR